MNLVAKVAEQQRAAGKRESGKLQPHLSCFGCTLAHSLLLDSAYLLTNTDVVLTHEPCPMYACTWHDLQECLQSCATGVQWRCCIRVSDESSLARRQLRVPSKPACTFISKLT